MEHLWALGAEGMQCRTHEGTYGLQLFRGLCGCCGLYKSRKRQTEHTNAAIAEILLGKKMEDVFTIIELFVTAKAQLTLRISRAADILGANCVAMICPMVYTAV